MTHPLEIEFLAICRRLLDDAWSDDIGLGATTHHNDGSITPSLLNAPQGREPKRPDHQFAHRMDRTIAVDLAARTIRLRSRHYEHAIGEAWQPDDWRARLEARFRPMLSMTYGFETNAGWCDLLAATFETYAAAGEQPNFSQIKEKFGGLRMYGITPAGALDDLEEHAGYLSVCICETCGTPGERRGGGWISTLCDRHHEERSRR